MNTFWVEVVFVPDWYPAVCLGFDIAIAGYVVGLKYAGNARQVATKRIS